MTEKRKFDELSLAEKAKAMIAESNEPLSKELLFKHLNINEDALDHADRESLQQVLNQSIWTESKGWREIKYEEEPPQVKMPLGRRYVNPESDEKRAIEISRRNQKLRQDTLLAKLRAEKEVESGKQLFWDLKPEQTWEELRIEGSEASDYLQDKIMKDLKDMGGIEGLLGKMKL